MDLPSCVVHLICSYLDIPSFISFSSTCKTIRNDDTLFKNYFSSLGFPFLSTGELITSPFLSSPLFSWKAQYIPLKTLNKAPCTFVKAPVVFVFGAHSTGKSALCVATQNAIFPQNSGKIESETYTLCRTLTQMPMCVTLVDLPLEEVVCPSVLHDRSVEQNHFLVCLCFRTDNRASFLALPEIFERIQGTYLETGPMMLVGTCVDLPRKVSSLEAALMASLFHSDYFETSSKSLFNVHNPCAMTLKNSRMAGNPYSIPDDCWLPRCIHLLRSSLYSQLKPPKHSQREQKSQKCITM